VFSSLAALVLGEAAAAAKRKAFAAAFYLFAALLLIFAFGYALVAVRAWLDHSYDLRYPDLWIAAGLAVASAPFVILGVRKQRQRSNRDVVATAAMIAAPTVARATRTISPQLAAIVAVASLGLWLGRRLGRP
jgi:uncharacterized membrane protein